MRLSRLDRPNLPPEHWEHAHSPTFASVLETPTCILRWAAVRKRRTWWVITPNRLDVLTQKTFARLWRQDGGILCLSGNRRLIFVCLSLPSSLTSGVCPQ
jgi:hypothetical protein